MFFIYGFVDDECITSKYPWQRFISHDKYEDKQAEKGNSTMADYNIYKYILKFMCNPLMITKARLRVPLIINQNIYESISQLFFGQLKLSCRNNK